MTPLEKKKIQAELLGVQAAKANMEYRILERLEDIERMKEQIAIQQAKEDELTQKLGN